MWIDKLAGGVVRILTPIGPRYIELTFWQRVYFLWIFRYFDKLPQQVLSVRQQRLVDSLCVGPKFISLRATIDHAPLIGTLERLPLKHVEESVAKRPVASVTDAAATSPLVVDLQQRS
jgi:hypothetical protein